MKTPCRVRPEELSESIRTWLDSKVVRNPSAVTWTCKVCGEPIASRMVTFSIHYSEFESCSGPGTVRTLPIPFCRACEEAPAESGCIHISAFAGQQGTLFS